jgi:hypothetical protein
MSYLQLAENPYEHLAQTSTINASDNYIFIPAGYRGAVKDMYVREDLLDPMPNISYQKMMFELEPYQNTGMSAKEDRDARRQSRKDRKALRGETRDARKEARLSRIQSGETPLKTLIGGATNIVSSLFGGGNAPADDTTGRAPITGSIEFGDVPQQSFLSRYKVPLIIGAAGVIGFVVYKQMNKKKRK